MQTNKQNKKGILSLSIIIGMVGLVILSTTILANFDLKKGQQLYPIPAMVTHGKVLVLEPQESFKCNSNFEGAIYYDKEKRSFFGCNGFSWQELGLNTGGE